MTQKGCWHFIYVSDKQHSALHHKCDYSIFLFCRCSCQRTYKHSVRQRDSLVRLESMRKTCQPRRCGPPSENHCSSQRIFQAKFHLDPLSALKRRCFFGWFDDRKISSQFFALVSSINGFLEIWNGSIAIGSLFNLVRWAACNRKGTN